MATTISPIYQHSKWLMTTIINSFQWRKLTNGKHIDRYRERYRALVISTLNMNIRLLNVRQTIGDLIFIDVLCLHVGLSCWLCFCMVNMRFICDKYHIYTSIIIIILIEDERAEKMRRIKNKNFKRRKHATTDNDDGAADDDNDG